MRRSTPSARPSSRSISRTTAVLRFEVRDDGAGFNSLTEKAGVGLTSMRDRVAAVSGQLAVVSSPGGGTRVIGHIPLRERPDRSPGLSAPRPRAMS